MAVIKEKKAEKKTAFYDYIIISFVLIIFWILQKPRFATNDDYGLMSILAGYKSGTPSAVSFYCEYLYSVIVSGLYSINSFIPWYILIFLFLMLTNCLCLYYAISKIISDSGINKYSRAMAFFVFVCFFFGIYIFNLVYITFSIVPAVCGCSVVLLILTMKDENVSVTNNIVTGIIFVLFFFAWNIRIESGYVAIFSAISAIAYAVYSSRINIRRGLILAVGIVSIMAISIFTDWYIGIDSGWNEFKFFYDACGQYTDYTHLTFEEAPDLYQSIGWNENLYHLVGDWFFMDDKVNFQAFDTLNKAVANETFYGYSSRRALLVGMFNTFKNSSLWIKVFAGIWVITVIFVSICRLVKSKDRKAAIKDVLGPVLFLLLGFAFTSYLLMRGRFLDRAVYPVVFCTMLPSMILCFRIVLNMNSIQLIADKNNNNYQSLKVLSKTIITIACIAIAFGGLITANWDRYNPEYTKIKMSLERYVLDNDEYFFINDSSLTMTGDPFVVYPDKKPTNYTFWGGTYLKSPLYYKQIKMYGFEELSRDVFLREDVRFVSQRGISEVLLNYMKEEYPNCTAEITDQHDDFCVYRFIEN